MLTQNIFKLIVGSILLSGCSIVDKTLAPVDDVINKTKSGYSAIGNVTDETVGNISNSIDSMKADIYENSFVKLFSSDEKILKNREENFIKWDSRSKYSSKKIIRDFIRKNSSKIKEEDIDVSLKMSILKDYFFNMFEKEHIRMFEKDYKKVQFDEFLTDRENIENIYNYKAALMESEHKWNMNLLATQKKVAKLMLSTLYANVSVKFISYDPYDEELFLLVVSQDNNFEEKIKIDLDKELAKDIKNHIKNLKASVYYNINDEKLELVGIYLFYKGKNYLCDLVDTTYTKQNNIVFTSNDINLEKLNVDYTEVIKNIEPPEWYLNMDGDNIGYGQGKDLEEAIKNAYKNISLSKQVLVSTESSFEEQQSGSVYSSSGNVDVNLKSKHKIGKNKRIKEEQKDGIWFIAIRYDI